MPQRMEGKHERSRIPALGKKRNELFIFMTILS